MKSHERGVVWAIWNFSMINGTFDINITQNKHYFVMTGVKKASDYKIQSYLGLYLCYLSFSYV